MRLHTILIAAIALLPLSCKKETRETTSPATAKETTTSITTPPTICSGNIWQFDGRFYGDHKELDILRVVDARPIVYNNKAYVFDPDKDEMRIYDGTDWSHKQSQIPFDNPVGMGFTLGNKGYLLPAYSNDVWQYNFSNNTWSKKADFPGPVREGESSGVFTIGNKGYIAGGAEGGSSFGNYFNDTWEYDQASNTWTKKAAFSLFGQTDVSGFSIGNKGYLVNGRVSFFNFDIYSNNLQEYDPVTNSWTLKADFPGASRAGSAAFVIDGVAYVGGGSGDPSTGEIRRYTDYYKYTPGTNSWEKISNIPLSGAECITYFGFSINSKGYFVYRYYDVINYPGKYMYRYLPLICSTLPGSN
jgi:hypothetical protein